MFIRLPIVFICSLGWLQPTLGEDNFCLVNTCMKHEKQTKNLEEDVSNLLSELKMQKKNFNELKKSFKEQKKNFNELKSLLIEDVNIKKLSRNVGNLNDRLKEMKTNVDVLNNSLGNVEEIRSDVENLNNRVGNICEWYDDECYKLQIGEYAIANYSTEYNSCLTTSISEQRVSDVCHDRETEENLFYFLTGGDNGGERRRFHLNPYDAHVNIYGFPSGESTNDRIDDLEGNNNY